MAGRPKEDPTKTQQQEIAEKKVEFLRFYEKTGVKQAACDWIGRHANTVLEWEENDPDFREAVSKAKAQFLASVQRRLKPDNLVANLYQDYKPPKQEVASTVTVTTQQSAEDLLAEARALGLDTSAYDHLFRPAGDAPAPDRDQAGA